MSKDYEPRTRWNVENDRMEVSSRKKCLEECNLRLPFNKVTDTLIHQSL